MSDWLQFPEHLVSWNFQNKVVHRGYSDILGTANFNKNKRNIYFPSSDK